MKQRAKKLICIMLSLALCQSVSIGTIQTQAASQSQESTNSTLATATPIELGGSVSCACTTRDAVHDGETHYFKFTVPQNIGNQWIMAVVTASGRTYDVSILDSLGQPLLEKKHISYSGGTASFVTRMEGADTRLSSDHFINPGSTYYVRVIDATYSGDEGSFTVSVGSSKDDNWGTYEKAAQLSVGQRTSAKLEKWDDIDCFSVVLPNDNRKYVFNISSDNQIKVSYTNGNRILLSSVSVAANATDNSYSVTGRGQRIYIRLQTKDENVSAANYSINVSAHVPKKTISKLKLSKYKKKTKKIVGTTIGNATVKVKVNKKTYTVKSNKKGKFTVKLKKKLKSKNKIKVSVSKSGYKTKKQTFTVK